MSSSHARALDRLGLDTCAQNEPPVLFWRSRETLAVPLEAADVRMYNELAAARGWNRSAEATRTQALERAQRNADSVRRIEDEYAFLTSTDLRPFVAHGRTFRSIEHYVTWRKAVMFNDLQLAAAVLRVQHPVMAQRMRRLVHGFPRVPLKRWQGARAAFVEEQRSANDRRWEAARDQVFRDAVRAKCASNSVWCQQLLATGRRCIGEGNPFDPVFSVLRDGRRERPTNDHWPARMLRVRDWDGDNTLGRALSHVRDMLRMEQP